MLSTHIERISFSFPLPSSAFGGLGLPNLADRAKRQNLGVISIPGNLSHMNGTKVLLAEELCRSLDHDFMRSDHSELEAQMVIYESHSGEMEELCSL